MDEKTGKFMHATVLCRAPGGRPVTAAPKDIHYMDVNPAQIRLGQDGADRSSSTTTPTRALGRRHAAAGGADHGAPLIGTGLGTSMTVDTGDVVLANDAGTIVDVDADKIVVETKDGRDEYELIKFMRSNQRTLHPPEAGRRSR